MPGPFPDGSERANAIQVGLAGDEGPGDEFVVWVQGLKGEEPNQQAHAGLYTETDAVVTTEDTNPSTGLPFRSSFTFPQMVDDQVLFRHVQDSDVAIVRVGPGGSSVVVDYDTPLPAPFAGSFATILIPSASPAGVVFEGRSDQPMATAALWFRSLSTAPIVPFITATTPIPGEAGEFFDDLSNSNPAISDDEVLFRHPTGVHVFPLAGGPGRRVAGPGTPIPGGSGNFTSFPSITLNDIDGGDAVFVAEGSGGQSGLYAEIGGTLHKVVDRNSVPPQGGSFFLENPFFPIAAISKRRVVFLARDGNFATGLYLWSDGVLTSLLLPGDTLEGGTVTDVAFPSTGLADDMVAAKVTILVEGFGEKTCIYTGTLPDAQPTTTLPTSTTVTTSTTLPTELCGDANGNGDLNATDALVALRAAVGSFECLLCRCDTDSSGNINAADALRILRKAVGQPIPLSCVSCGG